MLHLLWNEAISVWCLFLFFACIRGATNNSLCKFYSVEFYVEKFNPLLDSACQHTRILFVATKYCVFFRCCKVNTQWRMISFMLYIYINRSENVCSQCVCVSVFWKRSIKLKGFTCNFIRTSIWCTFKSYTIRAALRWIITLFFLSCEKFHTHAIWNSFSVNNQLKQGE